MTCVCTGPIRSTRDPSFSMDINQERETLLVGESSPEFPTPSLFARTLNSRNFKV